MQQQEQKPLTPEQQAELQQQEIQWQRECFQNAQKHLAEKGIMPKGREPEHMKVRSVAVVLDPDEDYVEACKEAFKTGTGRERVTV